MLLQMIVKEGIFESPNFDPNFRFKNIPFQRLNG